MTFSGFNWEAWRQFFIVTLSFIDELAYVLGVALLIIFALQLKKIGDAQTSVTPSMLIWGLIAAITLVYFGNTHTGVAETVFLNDTNSFDSDEIARMTDSNPYAPFLFVLAMFSLFGLGMMLKGCYMIRYAGNPRFEGQHIGLKATLHVFFGALLYYSPAFSTLMAPNMSGFNMMQMFGL